MARNGKTKWIGRYLKYVLLLFAGLLVLVGVGIVPLNLFFVKGTISQAVKTNLGVELEIRGPLRLRLGFKPQLSASDILLYTPDAVDQPLLTVARLSIQPVLVKIFKGDIHLRNLSASDVVIDYCPASPPEPNTGPADGGRPSFAIQTLTLDQIQLHCDQPENRLSFIPEALDVAASGGLDKPVGLEISGSKAGEVIKLSATLGSLDSLLSDPSDFPLVAHLNAFGTVLDLDGVIHRPLSLPGLAARIQFESEDPALLLEQAGLSVPQMELLQFNADVTASPDELELHAAEGSLGQARFSLGGLARGFSDRPYFEFQAKLSQLDLDKLPADTPGESSTNSWQGFSIHPWSNELKQFDASVHITIDKLLSAPLAMENLAISARLDQGMLSIDRAEMNLDGSQISARAGLDLRAPCPELVSELQLNDVDLDFLNLFLDEDMTVGGRMGQANIGTVSCGENFGEHTGSLRVSSSFRQVDPVYQGVDLPMKFNSLAIEFGHQAPGRLEFDGILLEQHLAAEITFGSVADLLAESRWPMKLKATGAGSKLLIDGSAAFVNGMPRLDARLSLDVARFGALHPWIGSDPANQLAGKASTDFSFAEAGWSLANIDAQLGRSSLRGKLSRVVNENQPLLKAKLKSDLMELNELAGLFPDSEDGSSHSAPVTERSPISDDEWIAQWFSLPAIDFELSASRIAGIDFDVASVNINGRIRDRLIENSELSLEFEDIGIAGDLDADFRQRPWRLAYRVTADNLDIGHLLKRFSIAEDVMVRAQRLNFSFVSKGQSIRELLEQSRLEARIEELIWTGKKRPGEDLADELLLNHVEFTARPSSATNWSANGILNEVPIRLWMQTPSISETLDSETSLPLRLALGAGNDVAMVDALIDRQSDETFRADLSVSGQRTGPDPVRLSELKPPLDEYDLSTRLTVKKGALNLSGLEARLGISKMAGQMNVEERGDRLHFDVQMNSPYIETEDFVSWLDQWRSVDENGHHANTTDSQTTDYSEGLIAVLNREIDKLTQANTFNLAVTVEELYSAGNFLGKAQLGLMADEKEFHLKPLRITKPDGNVDAEYNGKYVESGVEAGLTIHVEHLEYGGLLRLLDSDSKANGLVYLDASVLATAPDWTHLASAVRGNLDLLMIPDDVEAGFLDLWAANLVFALLPTASGDGSGKKMNCLVARFKAEDGLMKSKNILLDSTDIVVRGRGSIDLGERELDLLFAPQAKREKFLSVSAPIEVTGPFDDFKVGVTSGGFVMTMFRWYMSLIYVPYKWLTGERFPVDGLATCYGAMNWDPDEIEIDN